MMYLPSPIGRRSQYYLRKQMGKGDISNSILDPSADADGTDLVDMP